MAFTVNKEQSVFGNKRIVLISCSVDSASGNVDTGLSQIDGFSFAPVSMATSSLTLKKNVGSGATSRPGILNVNSAASGDSFFLVVYGR
jgi:hypothetical protein